MAKKIPAFQFYPGDWLKDPSLRAVSSGARGLWMDMLCLMWETQPRGYLQTPFGAPLSDEQIARMTGNCSLEEVRGWLGELELLGVFSRTTQGVIYCRRLVRDEHKRCLCAEAGKRGGNPTLKGQSKGGSKGASKGRSKRNPTPSSSSSTSVNTSAGADVKGAVWPAFEPRPPDAEARDPPQEQPAPRPVRYDPAAAPLPEALDTAEFRAAWSAWLAYRKEARKPMTATTVARQLALCVELGVSDAVAAIEQSIRNGWQGLFEPKNGKPRGGLPIGPGQRHAADARREIGVF